MFFEIFLAILLGVTAGTFTGLTPGIHVNLISALMLSASAFLLNITSPLALSCFVVALATTHSFLDFIPSTFLGVPDSGTELAVLPAHGLVMEGKGRKAVILSLIGSLFSLVFASLLTPFLLASLVIVYPTLAPFIGYLLAILVLFLIVRDWRGGKSLFIFLLAGILGIITFQIPMASPMFPLLSGMFGVSILFESLFTQSAFPKQSNLACELKPARNYMPALFAATTAGTFTSIFPGLGSAQGAALTQSIRKSKDNDEYMVLVGGINTVNFVLSLVTFVTVNKARNGAVVAISSLLEPNNYTFWILLACALIAGGIATPLAMKITGIFCKLIPKINYKTLAISIMSIILLMTILLSGPIGLILLITSSALGLWTGHWQVPRQHQMGCLIVPVLTYFLL